MEDSAQQQIELIVRSLEERGVSAAPVGEAIALATSHPETVHELALAVMERFPKGGTFLDAALSYVPEGSWPDLAKRALNRLEESLGDNEGIGETGVGEDDGELVTAVACRDIRFADAVSDMPCHVEEYGVSGSVSMLVVDLFEVVQVDHNKGQVSTVAAAAGDFLVQFVVKGVVVDETGHAIGPGLVVDFFVEFDIGHG